LFAQAKLQLEQARQHYVLGQRLADAKQALDELVALLNSARYQLIHTQWRLLRGVDFENFLHRVFETLGYQVQPTKASTDQGADLIVSGKGILLAVQAKGYEKSVGNHSVMEVTAGMQFYRCNSCAVITNSGFTRAARRLAHATGCQLVDGSQIPDLIEGRIF
jgi:HJR/Mrr/RecB family endonuclease